MAVVSGPASAATTAGPKGFEGSHYRLAEFDPHPYPVNLRLVVGGSGAIKTPRLAGMFADEFNIYACSPDEFAEKATRARDAAEAAGRDPDALVMTAAGPAVAAEDEETYRSLLSAMAELTGSSPEHIVETYRGRAWPHGPGAQAAEMLEELEAAGCRRYYMQMFGAVDLDLYDSIFAAFGGRP